MGRAFVQRALACGHQVTIWNRSVRDTEALRLAGASESRGLRSALEHCDAALIVVSDDRAVQDICLSAGGALEALPAGAVLVNASTVSPETASLLKERSPSGRVVNAPVMGSPTTVVKGQAKFFLGGERSVVSELDTLWADLAQRSFYCGDVASASILKLMSNSLLIVNLAALAEMVTIARVNGVSDDLLAEILEDSVITSQADRARLAPLLSETHDGWFAPALGLKDLRLALTLGAASRVDMRIAPVVDTLLTELIDRGTEWSDIAAVIEVFRFPSKGSQ